MNESVCHNVWIRNGRTSSPDELMTSMSLMVDDTIEIDNGCPKGCDHNFKMFFQPSFLRMGEDVPAILR